jgi:hypothetical protein
MPAHPAPAQATPPDPAYRRAIHLRITEGEARQLQAHAEALSRTRRTRVSLSEAIRDLLGQALGKPGEQPWETALKGLPFVTWNGDRPALPPLEVRPEGLDLAALVLEDRGEA